MPVVKRITPVFPEFLDAIVARVVLQARLPLRKGGLGLPAAADISKRAYLGGMAVTAQFLNRGVGVNLWLDLGASRRGFPSGVNGDS
eukprot:COSAG02_NODE_1230_length_13767_cov_16.238294_16_plen_87_part_00